MVCTVSTFTRKNFYLAVSRARCTTPRRSAVPEIAFVFFEMIVFVSSALLKTASGARGGACFRPRLRSGRGTRAPGGAGGTVRAARAACLRGPDPPAKIVRPTDWEHRHVKISFLLSFEAVGKYMYIAG